MSNIIDFSINLLETEIDDVIFQTNQFLTDGDFIGAQGPFWWILQISMALGACFSLVVAAGMVYKMLVKKEGIDALKIIRVIGIATVMLLWYPPSKSGVGVGLGNGDWCILDGLAYIPNAIGSYTHDLYMAEASQVQATYNEVQQKIYERDSIAAPKLAEVAAAQEQIAKTAQKVGEKGAADVEKEKKETEQAMEMLTVTTAGGTVIFIDKILLFLAMVMYRIGWWGTIYAQQLLLGMLTIFGPIQWAFSILPKYEGAWAKWVTRYLVTHFYGAMLYFVGFYVLLLFDIVVNIQSLDLSAIIASDETMQEYLKNSFFTCGYMLAASVVSLKCLSMVPDLASWMIPEGDTAFSIRSFGEGVANGVRGPLTGIARKANPL